MWRALETGSRQVLNGHEGGNPGHKPRMSLRATAPVLDPTNADAGRTGTLQECEVAVHSYTLEKVFQRKLELAHSDSRAVHGPKRGRLDVYIRGTPHRVIQHVERLESKLQCVFFQVRHPELLVCRKIQGNEAGPHNAVPPDVAESAGGLEGKGGAGETA